MFDQVPSDLRRLSAFMRWFCLIALLLLVLAAIVLGLGTLANPSSIADRFPDARIYPELIGRGRIALVLGINAISVILICSALLALRDMFGAFQRGDILTEGTATLMRRAGGYFLAAALWGVLAETLTILVLTAVNPAGEKQLSVGFSGEALFPLLLAGVLFAIGQVLTMAAAINAENKEFV